MKKIFSNDREKANVVTIDKKMITNFNKLPACFPSFNLQ